MPAIGSTPDSASRSIAQYTDLWGSISDTSLVDGELVFANETEPDRIPTYWYLAKTSTVTPEPLVTPYPSIISVPTTTAILSALNALPPGPKTTAQGFAEVVSNPTAYAGRWFKLLIVTQVPLVVRTVGMVTPAGVLALPQGTILTIDNGLQGAEIWFKSSGLNTSAGWVQK